MGSNPTNGMFALATPSEPGVTASLSVYDLSGRRVAVVRGPAGSQLVWDGRGHGGALLGPGIYLYRLEVERFRRDGKVVVVR